MSFSPVRPLKGRTVSLMISSPSRMDTGASHTMAPHFCQSGLSPFFTVCPAFQQQGATCCFPDTLGDFLSPPSAPALSQARNYPLRVWPGTSPSLQGWLRSQFFRAAFPDFSNGHQALPCASSLAPSSVTASVALCDDYKSEHFLPAPLTVSVADRG